MNKMTFALALGAFAAIPLLSACDDGPKASSDNFRQALQRYYDTEPVCISIAANLPIEIPADGDNITKRQLEALTRAGLLSVESFRKIEPAILESPERTSDHLRYRPTEAGTAAVRPTADSFIGGTRICFAKRQITEVTSFTEPADALGVKSSRVTYRYDFKDVKPWALRDGVRAAFPGIARLIDGTPDPRTDTLVLTGDGWTHERAAR